MSATAPSGWASSGLRFFGAVTASQTHEINNALAVVNELAGLISDLATAAASGPALDPERIRLVAGRIAARVEDGKTFVKQLNRFAHVTDQASAKLDAAEALHQVVELCRRFARLEKVEMSVQADPLAIRGSPFDLQHVFFRTLEASLGLTAPGTTLGVALTSGPGTCLLRCNAARRESLAAESSTRLSFLRVLAEGLGGRLASELAAASDFELELVLPVNLPALPGFETGESAQEG